MQAFARDPAVKDCQADEGFPVQDRDGDLRAQQIELLEHERVALRLDAVAAQDAAVAEQMPANAGFERQLEMFQQARGQADGAGGPQFGGRRPAQ